MPSTPGIPAGACSKAVVLQTYRTLARMIARLPDNLKKETFETQLRNGFKAPLAADETVQDRLKVAGEKVAFLRIISPKEINPATGKGGRWIYRNGQRIEDGEGTTMNGSRVVNGFTGHNLDPCMVKRHNATLKRAGFVNNLHAKGIF